MSARSLSQTLLAAWDWELPGLEEKDFLWLLFPSLFLFKESLVNSLHFLPSLMRIVRVQPCPAFYGMTVPSYKAVK